jgi:hypothetical protein
MAVITLHARRWFERTNGNTHHTVTIEIDGKEVGTTPTTYGYGDMYIRTAFDWLVENGYLTKLHPAQAYSEFSRIHGHGFYVVDVPRKKDL